MLMGEDANLVAFKPKGKPEITGSLHVSLDYRADGTIAMLRIHDVDAPSKDQQIWIRICL